MMRGLAAQSARTSKRHLLRPRTTSSTTALQRCCRLPSSFSSCSSSPFAAAASSSLLPLRYGLSSSSFSTSPSDAVKAAAKAPAASPSDVVVEEEEAGQGEKPAPYQEVAFPWRPDPRPPLSFMQMVSKTFHDFLPQAYIRGLFYNAVGNLMETPSEDMPELLFRSTRFAFIQAVRAIFDGQCKTPPPTWEYTNEENKISTEWELGYPPLHAMMDSKLVAMYEHAVERFRANKRVVRLELESITPLHIQDVKLVIGPPRGEPLPAGATKHHKLGVTVIAASAPEKEEPAGDWGQSFMQQIRPRLAPNFHYLFQCAVTFRCKELFCVTNEETGEVVQGADEVVETSHTVLFEIDFDKHAQKSQDWRIVDVDYWLDGNEYLAEIPDGGEIPTEGEARRKDD